MFSVKPYRYSWLDAFKVARVVFKGNLGQTREISLFEQEFSQFVKTKFTLTTNSGTSALELAFQAIGLRPGEEVIMPGYTFIAAAQAVLTRGGIPKFADIDATFNLSPSSIIKKVTVKTRAILVVHMFGNVADLDAITKFAKQRKLIVIEDCAQALGASFRGKKVGAWGDIGCFSFNAKKALPTGQGGALVTNNPVFYRRAKLARNTGIDAEDSKVKTFGHTFYMTEFQAALARSVLPAVLKLNIKRANNFHYLVSKLAKFKEFITVYKILPQAQPSYSRLVLIVNFRALGFKRSNVLAKLANYGLPFQTFYPTPLYRFPLFKQKRDLLSRISFPFSLQAGLSYQIKLPFVEKFCREQIGMEFSPYLNRADLDYLVEIFARVFPK